ncbi:MAG: dTMP kinase [Candidatus Chaera renei]|uniref:Thymidylate kinase n=1 Tax=Candidatus Chaera renei TaxID=2506947 RepID=A0A4Q0AG43_9BACT|nr:MAG: dTMP kinase [Candidatus Chaera renei]
MSERGKYIVLEGHDGTGKSEQARRLIGRLGSLGISCLQAPIEEPGGSPASDELRKIIKNGNLPRDPWSNVLMFTAARRLSWLQTIQPALNRGVWAVAARNWISTAVYQGYGQGADVAKIRSFTGDNVHPDYLNPDAQLILTLDSQLTRRQRIADRDEQPESPDIFESMPDDFQRKVQDGYEAFARRFNVATVPVVNRSDLPKQASIELTGRRIWRHVSRLIQ